MTNDQIDEIKSFMVYLVFKHEMDGDIMAEFFRIELLKLYPQFENPREECLKLGDWLIAEQEKREQ